MRTSARVEWNAEPGRSYAFMLYSLDGRLLRTIGAITGGSVQLDRAGLPSGEYLFEIRDRANAVTARGRVGVE
jgi:hypothetical protein